MSMSNWYSEIVCLDKAEFLKIKAELIERYKPEVVPIMTFYESTKHLFKTIKHYAKCNTIDEEEYCRR